MFPTQYKGYSLELLGDVVVNVSHVRKLVISKEDIKILHEIRVPITENISINSESFFQIILAKSKEIIDDPDFNQLESKTFEYINDEFIEI